MLGDPSLPSLVIRLWRGERDDKVFCTRRALGDRTCDCIEDEEEHTVAGEAVVSAFEAPGCVSGRLGLRWAVELGSEGRAGKQGRAGRQGRAGKQPLAPPKGRKGGESAWSSSASDVGLWTVLELL